MLPIATTKAQSPNDVGLFGAGTGLVAASAEALGRFKIEISKLVQMKLFAFSPISGWTLW